MLMNDFDKTFLLAFYSSFLTIKLNCDQQNMLLLNTYSFHRKMLSNLMSALISSLTKCALKDGFKDSYVLKILENFKKYIHGRVYR